MADAKDVIAERTASLSDSVELSPVDFLKATIAAKDARIAELNAAVREWLCDACQRVYPGPPRAGLHCVICLQCGGNTGPRVTMEKRKADARIAELESRLHQIATASPDSTKTVLKRVRAYLDARLILDPKGHGPISVATMPGTAPAVLHASDLEMLLQYAAPQDEWAAFEEHWTGICKHGNDNGWRGVAWAAWKARAELATRSTEGA
jgi:hypothetical protein